VFLLYEVWCGSGSSVEPAVVADGAVRGEGEEGKLLSYANLRMDLDWLHSRWSMRHGSHPVLTYALLAAAVGLAGCNGGSNGSMSKTPVPPVPPTNPTATNSLLVGNLSSASIYSLLQFSKTSSGASSPIGSLDLPADFSFSAITTDRLGQIYVGGAIPSPSTSPGPIYQWEVLVYAANSVGSAAPIRTVVGSSSSFETVISMTVDASGQLYISSGQPVPAIAVMSASANGAAKAVRVQRQRMEMRRLR
jgi:hypothetical protein